MPLFGKPNEAEKRFKEAKRYIETSSEEFNLDRAIHLLEEAAALKPYEEKYRKELEGVKEVRSRLGEQFFMEVEDVFWIKGKGTVAVGRVQQGTIRSGDKVRIVGRLGERSDTVVSLEMFHKTLAYVVPGDAVGLLFEKLDREDVQRGDTIEKVEA